MQLYFAEPPMLLANMNMLSPVSITSAFSRLTTSTPLTVSLWLPTKMKAAALYNVSASYEPPKLFAHAPYSRSILD